MAQESTEPETQTEETTTTPQTTTLDEDVVESYLHRYPENNLFTLKKN